MGLRPRKLCDLGQDGPSLDPPRRSDILNIVTTALGRSGLLPGPAATPGQGPGRSGSPGAGTRSSSEKDGRDEERLQLPIPDSRAPAEAGTRGGLRSGQAQGTLGLVVPRGFRKGHLDLAGGLLSGAALAQ